VHVLVADDNEDNRQLLDDILRGAGYAPLFAADGYEALEVINQHKPDLVILDISMPGLNGFDVCAQMKANPDTRAIPVLMLTALMDIESRVRGLGLGADDYVTKPYSPRELVARVDARLRVKSDTDALRAKEQLIRQTFERFVPPAVVNRLLEQPETVRLGGALQEVTILFADLQGFTTLAEHTRPERLLAVLNAYHGLFVRHVQAQEGTLDKFMGDGVMALYNTPLPQEDHALRAVQSAVHILQALPEFHAALEPTYRLQINFGINTGQAVIGMVGADEMMEFTAIGDAVNLASRLQDRGYGGEILVSEATYQRIAPQVNAECLGPQAVRNRAAPVVIYRVTGLA
jgi:adenylate cyclase